MIKSHNTTLHTWHEFSHWKTDYVDGVSITHGSPRTHIWTYAAGASDNLVSGADSIEVRICGTDTTDREDTPITLLELYIQ